MYNKHWCLSSQLKEGYIGIFVTDVTRNISYKKDSRIINGKPDSFL